MEDEVRCLQAARVAVGIAGLQATTPMDGD
jgi:hypothetical protein